MAEIDQNNLHMKFSALNVDYNSLSPNPLLSRSVAQAGIKTSNLSKAHETCDSFSSFYSQVVLI